jgi:acyl-CoA thioester hydrolase
MINNKPTSEKKLLKTLQFPLRWMDLDGYGHVGNARFYDFMTDIRVEAFKDSGFLDLSSIQFVVAESTCTYKVPCEYPGNVLIKMFCTHLGNSSLTLSYEFYNLDDLNILHAAGSTVMVCYNAELKRAVRIPDHIREFIECQK